MTEENKAVAQPAVLRATIQITRKATGKVEEYELIGTAPEIEDQALEAEANEPPQHA